MNLFLVESPTQVLNALEAKFHFQEETNILLILETGLFERAMFENILNYRDWSRIEFVEFTFRGRNLDFGLNPARSILDRAREIGLSFDQIWKKYRIERLARRFGPASRLILGQYRSDVHLWFRHFAQCCFYDELFLLDDGTDTVLINSQRGSEGRGNNMEFLQPLKEGLKSKIKRQLVDWDALGVPSLTFFTSVDIQPNPWDRIIRNEYRYLRSVAKVNNPSNNRVFFLGQTLIDDGYLKKDEFFAMVEVVAAHYKDRPVVYVPHPRESNRYVEEIRKRTSFTITRFDVPFEFEITARGNRPRTIAGFFSSALENCTKLLNSEVEIEAFAIENSLFLKQSELIKQFYEHFENLDRIRVLPCADIDDL